MSESWQEFAKRQSEYALKLEREIATLREQLRDTHTKEFYLGEKLSAMEQERDQFASMLYDCENERDGWKHRAERMERVVEAARAWERSTGLTSAATGAVLIASVRALDAEAQG